MSQSAVTSPLHIWLELGHREKYRLGGWAFLRKGPGGLVGTAGGARQLDPERASLLAFAAAVASAPDGAGVELHTASPDILLLPARIAAAERGKDAPTKNLDAWAQAATALRRVRLTTHRAQPLPGGPTAFAAAWAEFALDRARDKGAFTAVIPKSNLAKVRL